MKKGKNNFPKTAKVLQDLSVLLFLSFLFLLILSHDNKQERVIMNNAAEILKSVQIGLDVCIFLLNTDRGLQATDLCNECTTLLQNLGTGIQLIFHTHYTIFANHKLLETLLNVGILTTQLGDKYEAQSRFVEAKQLFESALAIWKTIGHKEVEGLAHGRLGDVCYFRSEMQNAEKYYQKALAIAIEIGDRQLQETSTGKLGTVFNSLGKYLKAREYHEKALAIAIEIGDREGEGRRYGSQYCREIGRAHV